jgi:hypothetical protein
MAWRSVLEQQIDSAGDAYEAVSGDGPEVGKLESDREVFAAAALRSSLLSSDPRLTPLLGRRRMGALASFLRLRYEEGVRDSKEHLPPASAGPRILFAIRLAWSLNCGIRAGHELHRRRESAAPGCIARVPKDDVRFSERLF